MTTEHNTSPFHAGEHAVQRRVGVDERIEEVGRRMFRDHLLQQHQDFFAGQHQLFIASLDAQARPWASLVAGPAGFVHALSPTRLRVDALPVTADEQHQLAPGDLLGVLGIDYSNRRRNRVNGRIVTIDDAGFELQVDSSFGNCPKYIQTRQTTLPPGDDWRITPRLGESIKPGATMLRKLIATADHFYIATHHQRDSDPARHGADISHRGGKPGFVQMDEAGAVVFPDFAGNRFFNSLGNIEMNGKASLLFIDFDSGSMVTMTGTASIDWQDAEQSGFAAAERLLRWQAQECLYYPNALPFKWQFNEFSPALASTGTWV